MRVHHLNCGSLTTVDPVDATDDSRRVVCHCLLVETDDAGLVLVDSGLGTRDIAHPTERLGADWVTFAGPVLDPAETALHQVRRLGYSPDDVRHVLVTHAHNDHLGGLADFPGATVHLHEAEPLEEHAGQLDHGPRVLTFGEGGEEWFGFKGARVPDGLPPEILTIPLAGHTPGHVGVAVNTGDRWLLHAGDTYFFHGEVDRPEPVTHPVMQLVQDNGETDRAVRLDNVARLRELTLTRGGEVEVFSAHDPWEFSRLSRGGARAPYGGGPR